MLYKGKGEKSGVNSYRGLTLLNTTPEVFERIWLARLTVFSEKYDLIHNNQNGFRPNRDCAGHLTALQQALEANPNARAVFVDIRKAYPHSIPAWAVCEASTERGGGADTRGHTAVV